jgi:NAD(P)-dependent dehydrogenase (short-subunit alcohol dehydrogenase family)
VLLIGRTQAPLAQACTDLCARGGKAAYLCADVTASDAFARIQQAALAELGAIDILVNAAGAFVYKDVRALTPDDWHQTLATNLTAPFCLSQGLIAAWTDAQRGGCILNIGSVHGVVGDGQAVPQCAAKSGLVGLTRALAEAGRPYGIRVNSIAPGAIAPDSAERPSADLLGRVTQGDVAQLAVWLASAGASAVTGVSVDVFGGSRPALPAPAPLRRPSGGT